MNSPSRAKLVRLTGFFIVALFLCFHSFGQHYKAMMEDPNINFYDVVNEANQYFAAHGKGKGSGWKQFERWVVESEHKYYPSGDRTSEDPFFASKNFNEFIENNPSGASLFPIGWNELGPSFSGQITGHYAFGLGRIVSFYVDPNNDQRLYLGSRTGGFWSSLDGGATWSGGSTDFLAASGVNAIAASPTNSDSVLININNSTNHYSHGIYRSIDGGANWVLSNFNPTNLGWGGLGSNREIYKIQYHPTIPNLIFVGTRVGLYRSIDNLATWTVPLVNDDFTDIDFHPTDPNIIYAYAKNTPNEVYVSTDAGVTFSSTAIPGSSGGVGTVAVSASCPNCVYYCSNNGFWKSTDSGASFTLISTSGVSDAGFAVNDLNDNNILAGYVDAFFSTDGGANFNQITYWSLGNTNGAGSGHQVSYNTSTDYIHADLQSAQCINGVFYASTDGFLVKSTDNGATWSILSEGTGIRMNYNLGVSQSNHYRTICGSQDNGTSINTESGWVEMYGADGMEALIHPLNDDWMIGSWQYGGRRRTFDGGQTSSTVTPGGQNGYWIAPMLYDPNEQMRIYSFGENVFKSDDFGDSWTNVGTPSFAGTIKFASIAENNTDIIVAAANQHIELSTDGGATFTDIKGTLPNYSITDVVFDPNDDNTIIVTYARYQNDNSKIYITNDQGATWQNITYNLGNMPIRSVVIDHTNASTIYIGTEIGVYKKAMSDVSWSLYNSALPNMSVKELEIMWGSNTLRAATWGRGLWEFTLDGRLDFPTLLTTDITNPPTFDTPKATTDQYVTSTVTYDNALTSVYLEWSINTPIFGNVIAMSNSTGNEWVSDTPIPDQAIGTKVFFKVFAVGNSGDTTETYKFHYTVKPYEYCEALGSNGSGNLYLSSVTVDNMTNVSTNDAYTYYADSVIDLELNGTYTISLNANTSWASNDFGAWIDFNDDASFSGDELILTQVDASGSASASFTVPSTAVLNDTLRLRIRLGYWDSPELDPCGTTLGEVEDYPVLISNPNGLPTELIYFTGHLDNNKGRLFWTTASEYNSSHFDVQRSVDGSDWETLGMVESAENSNTIRNYEFTDYKTQRGINYYRLKQVDLNGDFEFSKSISLNLNLDFVQMLPNPANTFVILRGENIKEMKVDLVSNKGQFMSISTREIGQDQLVLDVSTMAKGIYFVQIKHVYGTEVKKLVIN